MFGLDLANVKKRPTGDDKRRRRQESERERDREKERAMAPKRRKAARDTGETYTMQMVVWLLREMFGLINQIMTMLRFVTPPAAAAAVCCARTPCIAVCLC